MTLSVAQYSGDRLGGAARAASRLHAALRRHPNIQSDMIVAEKLNDDYTVSGVYPGKLGRLNAQFQSAVDALPRRIASMPDNMPRSAGWATQLTAKQVNAHPSDIAQLHWINGAFLSVEQIGKITKPVIWNLHDMWAFCGGEHLATDGPEARWRNGYAPSNEIKGFDFDRWVWRRKKASWKKPIHIVTPSLWLADCARQSSLMAHFPVHVIPNAIDVDIYKPMDKCEARRLLNLPQDRKLILFGAIKGTQLSYKGWDLLLPALAKVSADFPGADAVIFGQSQPAEPPPLQLPVHWMGHIHDDYTLAALYSAADLLIIPSRQESFGQTGSEAYACGRPVVAFDATGLKDVVANGETGRLATPYDPEALAAAIVELLANDEMRERFGVAGRARAERLWSFSAVASQYEALYRNVLTGK